MQFEVPLPSAGCQVLPPVLTGAGGGCPQLQSPAISLPRLAVGVRPSQFSSMSRALYLLFGQSGLGKFIEWVRCRSLLVRFRLLGRCIRFRMFNC